MRNIHSWKSIILNCARPAPRELGLQTLDVCECCGKSFAVTRSHTPYIRRCIAGRGWRMPPPPTFINARRPPKKVANQHSTSMSPNSPKIVYVIKQGFQIFKITIAQLPILRFLKNVCSIELFLIKNDSEIAQFI